MHRPEGAARNLQLKQARVERVTRYAVEQAMRRKAHRRAARPLRP